MAAPGCHFAGAERGASRSIIICLIISMPSFMAFMWSAIRAWRSSGVLAAIILSCISCIDFIMVSICAGDGVLAAVAGLCAAFAAGFACALTEAAGAEAPAG